MLKELSLKHGDVPSCRVCSSEPGQSQDSLSMEKHKQVGGAELIPAGR